MAAAVSDDNGISATVANSTCPSRMMSAERLWRLGAYGTVQPIIGGPFEPGNFARIARFWPQIFRASPIEFSAHEQAPSLLVTVRPSATSCLPGTSPLAARTPRIKPPFTCATRVVPQHAVGQSVLPAVPRLATLPPDLRPASRNRVSSHRQSGRSYPLGGERPAGGSEGKGIPVAIPQKIARGRRGLDSARSGTECRGRRNHPILASRFPR